MEDQDLTETGSSTVLTSTTEKSVNTIEATSAMCDMASTTADEHDNSTEDRMTSAATPPRASFMGLPVELRLKIYEYLFTRHLTPAQKMSLRKDMHCCANGPLRRGISCLSASETVHPDVLATCKQVSSEAFKSLYENLESRIHFMTLFHDPEYLSQEFGRIPIGARPFVKNLLLVGYLETARSQESAAKGCSQITTWLPNIKHLRLHVEMDGFGFAQFAFAEKDMLEGYGVLMSLPLLQSVHLELHFVEEDQPDSECFENALREMVTSKGQEYTVEQFGHAKHECE